MKTLVITIAAAILLSSCQQYMDNPMNAYIAPYKELKKTNAGLP